MYKYTINSGDYILLVLLMKMMVWIGLDEMRTREFANWKIVLFE